VVPDIEHLFFINDAASRRRRNTVGEAGEQHAIGSSQAERRAILRAYIRWTLYAEGPARLEVPTLTLPRLDPAILTEADVYTARPGGDDPHLDAEGRPRPRTFHQLHGATTLVRGPSGHDPVSLQAGHADAWRQYGTAELAKQPATLQFERDTVRALVQRLSPRDQQAVWDIGNRLPKEAASAHRCSLGAIKLASRDALDRLLALLYGAGAPGRKRPG
jgi:hypothetical protein